MAIVNITVTTHVEPTAKHLADKLAAQLASGADYVEATSENGTVYTAYTAVFHGEEVWCVGVVEDGETRRIHAPFSRALYAVLHMLRCAR